MYCKIPNPVLHSEKPTLYTILAFLSAVGCICGIKLLWLNESDIIAQINFSIHYYTPGIYAAGYIVFALTFVRSYVRSFVRSFVCSFVRYFPSRS